MYVVEYRRKMNMSFKIYQSFQIILHKRKNKKARKIICNLNLSVYNQLPLEFMHKQILQIPSCHIFWLSYYYELSKYNNLCTTIRTCLSNLLNYKKFSDYRKLPLQIWDSFKKVRITWKLTLKFYRSFQM